MNKIKIVVAGPRGKMGKETLHMIAQSNDLEIVAAIDHNHNGAMLSDFDDLPKVDVPIYTDIVDCFENIDANVLIDFTHPEAGKKHLKTAIDYGIRPVIGTSGFTSNEVKKFSGMMDEKKLGGIIAPNFAIGAVLLMKFSQMAAKYLPNVEIIEMHHDQKKDAPSGTATKTAELIKESRSKKAQGHPDEEETLQGARGADVDGMRIHSVRLPGLVAHQQVLFGGEGELLTLRHDSMNRLSFMNGVHYAVKTVMGLDTLVYGLENILD